MSITRSEAAFQRWLISHPALPGVGELLLVGRARRLERLVDLLFLTADGGLVLVEVKNECTTRQVIGQVLEYAARLHGATVQTIADDYGADVNALRTSFEQRFGRPLLLSPKRSIVFVAPEFDVTCHVTVPYLRELLADKQIEFHLVRAVPKEDDFELAQDIEPVLASRLSPGYCGVSLHGTCYVILEGGSGPILWRVGVVDEDAIVPSHRPSLRFEDRLLRPFASPSTPLNLTESGDSWTKQGDLESTAVVLGVLNDSIDGGMYHLVRLRSGRFEKFQRKRASDLHPRWARSARAFDWRQLRGLTKQ